MAKRMELEEAEVNLMVNILIERPWKTVNGLITKITQQMNDRAFQDEIGALKKELEAAKCPPAPPSS